MATDKRLDQVSTLTDFDYALIVKGDQVAKASKQQLAELVGNLLYGATNASSLATVTAGLSGGDEGEKVRFWAGSDIPDSAPFRVDETGNIIAEKGTFGGYLKTTLVDIDNSDATPVPSKYDSENFSAYRLNKNVYVDATFCEVVLPCSEDYSGVRVIIMDTYYTKSRVSTKPTLIRTEDDSKIACGLLKTDASTGKYLVNAIQIDCGTVELIYKSYENENGIKENGWIVISQSCGTFEEFNGIGYN